MFGLSSSPFSVWWSRSFPNNTAHTSWLLYHFPPLFPLAYPRNPEYQQTLPRHVLDNEHTKLSKKRSLRTLFMNSTDLLNANGIIFFSLRSHFLSFIAKSNGNRSPTSLFLLLLTSPPQRNSARFVSRKVRFMIDETKAGAFLLSLDPPPVRAFSPLLFFPSWPWLTDK